MWRKFFNGRYGLDNFSLVLLLLTLMFLNIPYAWILGVCLIGFVIFRTLSKNRFKREQELQSFNKIAYRLSAYLSPIISVISRLVRFIFKKAGNFISRIKQRKYFVFMKCPNCKKTLRLPKNKGKLNVTCPLCKTEFLKKT